MMSHPFVGSLEDKTLEELSETINTLNNKMAFASRSYNYGMVNQLQMVLTSYRTELAKRQSEMMGDLEKKRIGGKIQIT